MLVSFVWLVGIGLGLVFWTITVPFIFVAGLVAHLAGYRFDKGVTIFGAALTAVAVLILLSLPLYQIQIDAAASCSMEPGSSVMQSRAQSVRGPGGRTAVIRSELCDYGFAQSGVVHSVFVTADPHDLNRGNLVLRYTPAHDNFADGPTVHWSGDGLSISVRKDAMYALTHRRDRIEGISVHFDMHPKEDDSSLNKQLRDGDAEAMEMNLFYYLFIV